jgi:hypothetical protein
MKALQWIAQVRGFSPAQDNCLRLDTPGFYLRVPYYDSEL